MKKIMFVNSSLTDGGSERIMTLLANQLADDGYDITMILLRDKKKTYALDNRIKCIEFRYKYKSKIYILISRILKLRSAFKEYDPDIIISFMVDINCFTLISNMGLGNKVIVSERANPFIKRNILNRLGEKLLYKYADKIVVQTDMVKKYFNNYSDSKVIVIPNPVSSSGLIRKEECIKKYFIAIGRLVEQKNFKMLIDGFEIFCRENNEYTTYIYGEGPLKRELEEYIKSKNMEKKIFLMGYCDDIKKKIVNSSIYISTSNYEGISNSMLEAMSLGVPSICTDCPVGGARMIIENNKNGILVNINDSQKLAEKMLKIVGNEEFSKQLSNEAIKINEIYSIEKIIKVWESIF